MIKLKEDRKSTIEHDIYEAKVEEIMARWEAGIPFETENNNSTPPKKKRDNDEEK